MPEMAEINSLLPDGPGFVDQIREAESSGPDSVSPAGARGTMQVMPGTAIDPGFGIAPASGSNDLDRVGREYARAMLARYGGDRVLAAAAYNAGPGRVDQWIKDFGDPRTGGISAADWIGKIPIQETQKYAGKFLASDGLGQGTTTAKATVPSNQLGEQEQRPDQDQSSDLLAMLGAKSGNGPNPLVALKLLQLLVPNHQIQPVDYDPWAIGKAAHVG